MRMSFAANCYLSAGNILKDSNFAFLNIKDKYHAKIMRRKVKYLLIGLICFLATIQVQAQSEDRSYWLSLQVGHNEYRGDLGNEFFNFNVGSDFTWGFELSTYLSPSFDLGFNFVFGIIDYDRVFNNGTTESFSNPHINTSLHARYKISNGYLLAQNSKLQPYLIAGFGLTSYTGEGTRDVNGEEVSSTPTGSTFTIPFGLGIDIPVSESAKVVVRSVYNRTFAEGFDGRSMLDNANHDDYLVHSIGVKFALSQKQDSDGDGVSDGRDACPGLEGSKRFEGCPDTDGDGFDERSDFCPDVAGVDYLNGCPDTDGDKIEDSKDACPNIAGSVANNGCPADEPDEDEDPDEPDKDGDGIKDSEDRCPNDAGDVSLEGCPDDDGDGVEDSKDNCPTLAGNVATDGCPDEDGDQIIDSVDACPQEAANTANGCPESSDNDGDGIENTEDKCPNQAGVAERDGCPVAVTEAIREEIKIIARNLQFAVGQNTLVESASDDLDRLVAIMQMDTNLNLIIDAYTDSEGQAAYNLQLSKQRANAVKDYLAKKGIDDERLRAEGYGEILPIASNDTEEGRNENRRIELKLTYF